MSRRSLRTLRRAATLLSLGTIGLAACGAGTSPQGATAAAANADTATSTTMAMPPAPGPAAATAAAPVATNSVAIQNFAFGPTTVTVKVGATVTWTNHDDEAHTVFFVFDGSRSPILVNSANVYQKTFTAPGTYVYHCTIHPFMTGTVVVTA
jgi:plastocyanin